MNPLPKKLQLLVASMLGAIMVTALAACGTDNGGSSSGPDEVVIAYQPGIGYAPLIILKAEETLESKFPDTNIEWKELSSGAAITDGMISDEIQVGSGGSGPLILDWDKKTGIKAIAAMNSADLWLNAKDSEIKTVKDFDKGDKIAMPSPTSIQSVVLRKAAEKYLGDAKALDTTIVSMAHPDGLSALLSGQIQGHLTSPPFEFQEVSKGAHRVLGSKDLFGMTTFNSVFMNEDFYEDEPKFAEALYDGLIESTEKLNEDPDAAAKLLAEDAGGKPGADEFAEWIKNDAIEFKTEPEGLMELAKFMNKSGMIKDNPESWKDFVLPTLEDADGS